MRISWNWISEMVDVTGLTPEAMGDLLTSRGLEVESLERLDRGFEKVITVRILERLPHPQADRLSVCNVTTGSGEPLQIVCGAQNMKAGDIVALAQVGANLPNGLKIEQSKIRGVVSNGMLCSEEELKLAESSEGILILPQTTALGQPLAKVLGRSDSMLDLKLTANRGDCLSHLGIAREVASALGRPLKKTEVKPLATGKTPISIQLEAGDAAPQFFGTYIEGVKIGPSPAWMVKRLEALGSRSINNVVDASNLLMLELGHPTHAYDADQIKGGKIRVRNAQAGEQLPLLDGQTVTLTGAELVIADAERAIGLAGVMGGGNSEVSPGTTRIYLECAEFDAIRVRRTAFKHQRRTDAAQRFEKGIDPKNLPYVSARLAALIVELACGTIKGSEFAQLPVRANWQPKRVEVSPAYFEEFLGMPVSPEKAEQVLKGLGCEVQKSGATWTVLVPSFRLDMNIREDLAEEVARSIGYDQIRETTPTLSSAPTSMSQAKAAAELALIDRAKDVLFRMGMSETINFAFTSKTWLSKFGMKSTATLLNPLSEEHEALVPSLIPGLVRNVLDNWRRHFGSEVPAVRLFELRPTFAGPKGADGASQEIKAQSETETGVRENWKLAFALSGPRWAGGLRNDLAEVDFADVKALVESLFEQLGTKGVRLQPASTSRLTGDSVLSLVHPGKAVEILAGKDVAGHFGLLNPRFARELKIDVPLWIGELDWGVVSRLSRPASAGREFKVWSEFPPMERDFALMVKDEISADKITQVALKAGKPLAKVAKIFDIYKGSQVAEGMTSVAVRVIFYDESRSIQESEAETASKQILEAWKKELGAELRR